MKGSLLSYLSIPECSQISYVEISGSWVFPCGLCIGDELIGRVKYPDGILSRVHTDHHAQGHDGSDGWGLVETVELFDNSFKITVRCSCPQKEVAKQEGFGD